MDEKLKMVSIDIDLDYTNEYIAQLLGFESSFDLERLIWFIKRNWRVKEDEFIDLMANVGETSSYRWYIGNSNVDDKVLLVTLWWWQINDVGNRMLMVLMY